MFPRQFPVFGPRSQLFHATIALPTLRCTTHNASPSSTHTKVPADAGEEADRSPVWKSLQGWPILGLRGTSPLLPDQLVHPGRSDWNRDRTSLPQSRPAGLGPWRRSAIESDMIMEPGLDIQVITEKVHEESALVDRILQEMDRVVVGQR